MPNVLNFLTLYLSDSVTAAEGYAHSPVINHQVITTVVAVTLYALTLAVKHLLAHFPDIRDTLRSLQIVTAVVSGEQKPYIIILDIFLNLCGR